MTYNYIVILKIPPRLLFKNVYLDTKYHLETQAKSLTWIQNEQIISTEAGTPTVFRTCKVIERLHSYVRKLSQGTILCPRRLAWVSVWSFLFFFSFFRFLDQKRHNGLPIPLVCYLFTILSFRILAQESIGKNIDDWIQGKGDTHTHVLHVCEVFNECML